MYKEYRELIRNINYWTKEKLLRYLFPISDSAVFEISILEARQGQPITSCIAELQLVTTVEDTSGRIYLTRELLVEEGTVQGCCEVAYANAGSTFTS